MNNNTEITFWNHQEREFREVKKPELDFSQLNLKELKNSYEIWNNLYKRCWFFACLERINALAEAIQNKIAEENI